MGFEAKNGYRPTRLLRDGETIWGTDWNLRIVHTPGHSNDHICFYLSEEKALFTGDHVMGWSTSVIMAPDGNLRGYLASLERILNLDITVSYPAHGHPIHDTKRRVEELISHRHMRTRQIVGALHRGPKTIPEMVANVYTDVDPRLHGIARNSVLAHIEALVESGDVIVVRRKANPFDSEYALKDN
jgi:glyoxylase-like metal-dependent hydrolase (beta-lactamase superfamily II)